MPIDLRGGPAYVQATDDGAWVTVDRATGRRIARFDGAQAALDSLLELPVYGNAVQPSRFAGSTFRWLDASAEEPAPAEDGSQVTAPRIRSMIDQRNAAGADGAPCMIDGGTADSHAHASAEDGATPANGWTHAAAEWREPGGRVHLALFTELHPDVAPLVDSGRLAFGSVLFGQSKTDPEDARLFTHALTNMPVVSGLVPSSAFRSLPHADSMLFARARLTRTLIMSKTAKKSTEETKAARAASFADTVMAACGEACAACALVCEKCAASATKAGDAALAQACTSCAAACTACAEACKGGDMEACAKACDVCAQACDACESACKASSEPAAAKCAEACAECEAACKATAAACAKPEDEADPAAMASAPAEDAAKAETPTVAPEAPRADAPLAPEQAAAFAAEALPILAGILGSAADAAAVLDALKASAEKLKGAMAAAGSAPADGLPSDGSAPARAVTIGLESKVATLSARADEAAAETAKLRHELARRDLRDSVATRFATAKLVLADAARDELVDMALRAPEQDREKLIDLSLRAANVPPSGRAITEAPAPGQVVGSTGPVDADAALDAAQKAVDAEHADWPRARRAAEAYRRSRAAFVASEKGN